MMNWILTVGSSRTFEISTGRVSSNSSSHSLSPLMISIGEGEDVGRSLKGLIMSFCSCVAADFVGRAGSIIIACSTFFWILVTVFVVSWYARVENNWPMLSHPTNPHWKKKQAYECQFSACSCSAIDCMRAVFPTPQKPWIKNTELNRCGSSIQQIMSSFSLLHVPRKHLGGGSHANESCRAPWEMKLFRVWIPGVKCQCLKGKCSIYQN